MYIIKKEKGRAEENIFEYFILCERFSTKVK